MTQSISVTNDYFKNIDLSIKKTEIINFLKKIPSLKISEKSVWESRYWGKGVGAFQIEGLYKNIPVIIKIQGSKPKISENKILEKLNLIKDKKIRFPQTIFFLPWNKKNKYEVVAFEKIKADFIIVPHKLAEKNKYKNFFMLLNCIENSLLKLSLF